jgi:hypothetical protein
MGLHLARAEAVPHADGRRCAQCGDFIDPINWCPSCRGRSACRVHAKPYKRANAAFCNDAYRVEYRNSYIRDCLSREERKALRTKRRRYR